MVNWCYFTLLIGVNYNSIYNWWRGPPCKNQPKKPSFPGIDCRVSWYPAPNCSETPGIHTDQRSTRRCLRPLSPVHPWRDEKTQESCLGLEQPASDSDVNEGFSDKRDQGTRTGVPRSRTCTHGIYCSLGILGDNLPINTHHSIGLFLRDFPWRGTLGSGYIQLSHEGNGRVHLKVSMGLWTVTVSMKEVQVGPSFCGFYVSLGMVNSCLICWWNQISIPLRTLEKWRK